MKDLEKCEKCPDSEHEDWSCRCESRNIRVAKEIRRIQSHKGSRRLITNTVKFAVLSYNSLDATSGLSLNSCKNF